MAARPKRVQQKRTLLALALAAGFAVPAHGQERVASANLDILDLPTYSQLNEGAGDIQTTLAGLVLDGNDLPVALAVRLGDSPEQAQVAVESLLRGLGLEPALLEDGGWRVQTPLGRVLVPTDLLSRHGDADYALLSDMARLLGIRLEYDESAAAVVAGTNWPLAARQVAPPPEDVVRPDADVAAPGSNLSYWRTEAYVTHSDSGTSSLVASDVGGGLAGGFWRARYEDDLEQSNRLRDYAWVRTDGSLRWLLGNQRVNGHPLLGSFDLTGAQAAWTNRPDLLYTGMIGYGELVSGRVAPASNLRGSGPPGGVADLLYDGIVVARIAIPLDGRYEFRDLTLPRGVATRVQVALYEPGALGAPLRIEDRSGQASDQLLARGTVLHYAGFGQNGNPLDPGDTAEGSAAFYEGRYGLLPGLTVDVAGQQINGVDSWLTGLVGTLGPLGVASAYLAQRGDQQSWQVGGDGSRGAAFWRMQAREQDDGYAGVDQQGYSERYLETGWRGANWTLGLVGRDIEGALVAEPVRYLKPTLDWYPLSNLSLSARPDLRGDYQYTAQWSITPMTRIGAYFTNDSDRLELDHRINDRWRTTLGRVEFQGQARHSAMFTRSRRGASDYGLSLAVLESAGEFGYLASFDTELRPGLSLRVQAYDDPLVAAFGGGSGGPVLQLSFVADFAVTPQGLVAGSYRRSLVEQGGVSGQLVLPIEGDFGGAGAAVWVDGQRRGKVDENGRFHVRDLSPGIHRVQVDEGALPIEMSLDNPERWVEVRAGVVTPVQFPLGLSLGFGGQLRDADGAPVASTELVVVDAAGEVAARARSDAWGYYRIDGLKPGRYELRSANGTDLHGQMIELSNGFKFGVDARQPAGPPER